MEYWILVMWYVEYRGMIFFLMQQFEKIVVITSFFYMVNVFPFYRIIDLHITLTAVKSEGSKWPIAYGYYKGRIKLLDVCLPDSRAIQMSLEEKYRLQALHHVTLTRYIWRNVQVLVSVQANTICQEYMYSMPWVFEALGISFSSDGKLLNLLRQVLFKMLVCCSRQPD